MNAFNEWEDSINEVIRTTPELTNESLHLIELNDTIHRALIVISKFENLNQYEKTIFCKNLRDILDFATTRLQCNAYQVLAEREEGLR